MFCINPGFCVHPTCEYAIAPQDRLPFHRLQKSIQEIRHGYQVWRGVLAVEVFPHWTVLYTVDVRLNSSSSDDTASQAVLVAMELEPVTHSDA